MENIQIRTVRDLRNNFPEVEALIENHDPVVLTKKGRGAAVLINFDDFAAFDEYRHIRYVASKLKEAEEYAAKPDAIWRDAATVLDELQAKYGEL